MAKLYITEYAQPGNFQGGVVPVGREIGTDQTPVTIAGSSAQSAAMANNTRLVRLHTDAICSVLFGTNPTATTSTRRMAANQTEYFEVSPGNALKVAVISNT